MSPLLKPEEEPGPPSEGEEPPPVEADEVREMPSGVVGGIPPPDLGEEDASPSTVAEDSPDPLVGVQIDPNWPLEDSSTSPLMDVVAEGVIEGSCWLRLKRPWALASTAARTATAMA